MHLAFLQFAPQAQASLMAVAGRVLIKPQAVLKFVFSRDLLVRPVAIAAGVPYGRGGSRTNQASSLLRHGSHPMKNPSSQWPTFN